MSQIKILQDLPQGELPQREERLRNTCFVIFMQNDLPLGQNTQREERLRDKKENVFNQKSLGSASRRTSTGRREKPFFCAKNTKKFTQSFFSLCNLPQGKVSPHKNKKRFSSSFFSLSKEVIFEFLKVAVQKK